MGAGASAKQRYQAQNSDEAESLETLQEEGSEQALGSVAEITEVVLNNFLGELLEQENACQKLKEGIEGRLSDADKDEVNTLLRDFAAQSFANGKAEKQVKKLLNSLKEAKAMEKKRQEELKQKEKLHQELVKDLEDNVKKLKEELKQKEKLHQDLHEAQGERKETLQPEITATASSSDHVDRSSCVSAQYDLKDPHSLANFLKEADIRLVRARFLAELVVKKQPLPRRQKAPESALVSHDEVQDWANGTCNATICSISHAWESMEHPDPCGYQLGLMVNRLSMWEAARDCDFWVFYDFVSLFQFERFSDAEIRSFKAAMDNMHVMYAHECTVTLRIQTLTPDSLWQAVMKDAGVLIPVYDAETKSVVTKRLNDLKPNFNLYSVRGWCRAEMEWSSLRTINLQHQRICQADAEEVQSEGSCRVPMTPEKFESTMKDSKFTHKADAETVISLQAKVFQEKVSACESLVLEGVPAAQMAALAEVLPFYKSLKSLKLLKFECNKKEAMAFGEALAKIDVESLELEPGNDDSGRSMGKAIVKALGLNSSLTFINREFWKFAGSEVVAEALPRNKYFTRRLPFDAPVRFQELSLSRQRWGERSSLYSMTKAFASALEKNDISPFANIDMERKEIGDAGAKALGEMLTANTVVKSLNLASNGISDEGAQVLAKGLHTNRSLEVLDLHDNHFTSLAGQALAEMLTANTVVKSLNLASNGISDEGAQALIEALEANRTLETLVVDHEVAEVLRPVESSKRGRGDNFEVIDPQQDEQAAEKYDKEEELKEEELKEEESKDYEGLRREFPDEEDPEYESAHRWICEQRERRKMPPGIIRAARTGDVAAVRGFVRRKPAAVEWRYDGKTVLTYAAENGHVEVVKALLAARAAVEDRNGDLGPSWGPGSQPLHWAALNGRMAVVQLLLAANASLEPKDDDGDSPLLCAVLGGKLDVVQQLVAARARLDVVRRNGQTPLQLAESKGHKKVVEFLRAAASQT